MRLRLNWTLGGLNQRNSMDSVVDQLKIFQAQLEQNKDVANIDKGIEFNPYTNVVAYNMMAGLLPQSGSVPEGTKCTFCGSVSVSRTFIPTGGPYSGRITCDDCGKSESVLKHVTDRAFVVEPIDKSNHLTNVEGDKQELAP